MRQVLLFMLLFTLVVADEFKDKRTLDDSTVEARRLKRFKYLPFSILGLGGLNALSWFIAIKFKVIIIFLFIIGAAILSVKVLSGKSLLGGGCSSPGIEHITPYHSSESVEYSSYPGGGGGSGESTYLDHPPTGYSGGGSSGYSSGSSSYGSPYNAGSSEISADAPYPYPPAQKRTIKTRSIDDSENGRAEEDDEDKEIDIADITFAVLGVSKRACKKRFVCEFDFRSQLNPFFRIAYKFIRNGMFPTYDTLEQLEVKHYSDCRKMFPTCMTPDEEAEQLSETEATPAADEEDVDSAAEATESSEDNNEITEEKEPASAPKQNADKIGRLILRRMGALSRYF